jgi:hypothetical protein
MSLYVVDERPGFDVILGDTWCKQQGVVADFGVDEPSAYIPPNLWLRHNCIRSLPHATSGPTAAQSQQRPPMSAILSARWLSDDHIDCGPAFLLMLRPSQEDVDTTSRDQGTQNFQHKYSHLFDAHEVGAFKGTLVIAFDCNRTLNHQTDHPFDCVSRNCGNMSLR